MCYRNQGDGLLGLAIGLTVRALAGGTDGEDRHSYYLAYISPVPGSLGSPSTMWCPGTSNLAYQGWWPVATGAMELVSCPSLPASPRPLDTTLSQANCQFLKEALSAPFGCCMTFGVLEVWAIRLDMVCASHYPPGQFNGLLVGFLCVRAESPSKWLTNA